MCKLVTNRPLCGRWKKFGRGNEEVLFVSGDEEVLFCVLLTKCF